MTTEALHPDHLLPGHMVGPWRIVERLGVGGSSRVFKVERDGLFFTMKMALRPLSSEEEEGEEETSWRMTREVAALLTYSPLPNLLRVYAVDCWPHPKKGYLFFVMDFVDGDNWHGWRWRTPTHAAGLLDTFSEVVRTVGVLHSRGVYHRDLKAENILIRREDGRPFLIDFGNVRLPGAFTKTLGLPPGVIHLLPPEVLAYTRSELWKQNIPFQGGVPADLYALGVLLYQGLTDLHPFNPELPDETLLTAIATLPPKAPHLLNPRAPRSLSDIALKLLEKRPEDRYSDTEALLQALWNAGRERTSSAWKVPLFPASGNPTAQPPPQESAQVARLPDVTHEVPQEARPPRKEEHQAEARQEAPATLGRPRRARWPLALLASLTVLGLALWLAHSTLASPPEALLPGSGHSEKGSPPVSTPPRSTPSSFLAAWLCAVVGLGCPAAQVKPPEPADCSEEAKEAMFEKLKLSTASPLYATLDSNQPVDMTDIGTRQGAPVISRIRRGAGNLPEGTLLHGRLWMGPGITDRGPGRSRPAVMGRYTLAVLPDGRKYPVCIVLGDGEDGYIGIDEGSSLNPSVAFRDHKLAVSPVERWP
ncbi:protein kinase [Vitiosangium sp. GDMCC 1.1324]|uniref:serine/threonine protein kinase n=1 Tax=Vitiosangium sp. (strain GDMCC 1.1324) TaxID=2138576 RepID=UPI000D34E609|nr:protein kinase [Vitiosangium sp. GDMCC 1.1324]PTL79903.1 serine/threonine protein kinase [Vitiosangium sp. GDMCC 1.1324]